MGIQLAALAKSAISSTSRKNGLSTMLENAAPTRGGEVS